VNSGHTNFETPYYTIFFSLRTDADVGHIPAGHIPVINTGFWNITSLFVFFLLSFPFHCSIVSRAKNVAQSVHRQPSDWVVRVRIPVGTRSFFLLHSVSTESGVHSISYPTCTGGEAGGASS
jgi:hypothetical protein